MSIRTAVATFRIGQALMLVNTLAALVDVGTPLRPRKPTSRDLTLTTSLRVIGEELERALADLEEMGVRRVG
jgi:hypothetical protein